MTLSDHQWEFLKDLALLIQFAERIGYKLTGGNLYRNYEQNLDVGGTSNSKHLRRLAIDLNLFIDDEYRQDTDAHEPLGIFWESIRPENRWGGAFEDGNHYERNV